MVKHYRDQRTCFIRSFRKMRTSCEEQWRTERVYSNTTHAYSRLTTHHATSNYTPTCLVGKSMEGSSKAVDASRKREVGVGKSTAHQVAGVSTDVASFMVTVVVF